jgi:hypothetical protein
MLRISFTTMLLVPTKYDTRTTANQVLRAVQQTLSAQGASSVTVVSHSPVGALLDGLFPSL